MPTKTATKPKVRRTAARPTKKAAAPARTGRADKGEGDAAVQAWIARIAPDHRVIVERLDALIGKLVPGVKKAVKWSAPFYGLPGQGWFASIGSFKNYVSLGFFSGASLKPPPPFGEGKTMRRVNMPTLADLDEKQVRSWIQQAAKIEGWGTV